MPSTLTRRELKRRPLADLQAIAEALGITGFRRLRKQELVHRILEVDASAETGARRPGWQGGNDEPSAADDDDLIIEGRVEVLPNGSGFVRGRDDGPSDDDFYVSSGQVKRLELVSGDWIRGPVRSPRRSERFRSFVRVQKQPSPSEGKARVQLTVLSFAVSANLTASHLIKFFTAVDTIYRALLITQLASGSKAADESEPDLTVVASVIDELVPGASIAVDSISITSPGQINLKGSGEILDGVDKLLRTVYLRKQIRQSEELRNARTALDTESAASEARQGAERHELELGMARYRAAKEILVDIYGPNVLQSEAGRRLLVDVITGTRTLVDLADAGLMELPPVAHTKVA